MAGVIERNNVHVRGAGDRAMVFAHGFGCDQNMWRFVAPAFEKDFMTLVFDHVGAGGSDLSAYDKTKYSSLSGYADDVVEIGRELGLQDAVFVGHSVSSMIGVLAARKAPGIFGKLVLVGPSARYIDDEGYVGDKLPGFGRSHRPRSRGGIGRRRQPRPRRERRRGAELQPHARLGRADGVTMTHPRGPSGSVRRPRPGPRAKVAARTGGRSGLDIDMRRHCKCARARPATRRWD